MRAHRFTGYAWFAVAYTVAVILWGAVVRATGSGAGCGSHWPDCNGQIVPRAPAMETAIEFLHRATSGVALLVVLGLAWWAWRRYPPGSRVRAAALAAVAFIVLEALIGAGLVLFGLVGDDDSVARAVVIAVHLANTLLLLAALSLVAWWSGGGQAPPARPGRGVALALGTGLAVLVVLAMSGAVTALGDTLFPARSLAGGTPAEAGAGTHFLVRLRVWHPLLAVVGSGYLLAMLAWLGRGTTSTTARRLTAVVGWLVVASLGVGAVNLALHAPVWLQVLHLLVADLLWIALVLLAAGALAGEAAGGRPRAGATPPPS